MNKITTSKFLSVKRKISSAKAVLLVLIAVLISDGAFSQSLWNSATTGGAWLTAGNWTPNGIPATTGYAQFQTNPTTTGNVGINMNSGSTNNGANNQAVGGIEVTGSRSVPLVIINSAGSATGTLTLNGTTINSVSNTILRNNTSQLFSIGGGPAFNVALANTTDNIVNIDGTGGITINNVVSGGNKLTKSGSGTGVFQLTGANTYTGLTTVSGGTMQLNRSGGTTIPNGNSIVVNSGATMLISTAQQLSNVTVDAGGTLIVAATLTVTGTATINGTFQINQGGYATGTFTYGAASTLVYNNTSGPYGVTAGHSYWPTGSTNQPFNVSFLNTGGVDVGSTTHTIAGTLTVSSAATNTGNLTVNGTLQRNTGGSIGNAPTYGASSTLVYNGTASVGNEWTGGGSTSVAAGSGVPANLSILTGTVTMPNANRGVPGNVTIASTLTLNATSGDLYVGGNFAQNGTLNNNSRAVFFVLGNAQSISSTGASVGFAYLLIDKTGGSTVTLSKPVTVANVLTLTAGFVDLGANDMTVTSSISGGSSTSYVKTSGAGQLKQVLAGSKTFPVGNAAYNPITLNNSGTSDTYGVLETDGTVPNANDATYAVNRRWYVTEAVAGGGNLSVVASYNSGEPAANFASGTTPYIGFYNGTTWSQVAATLAGGGPFTGSSNTNFTNSISNTTSYFAIGKDLAFIAGITPPNIASFSASPNDGTATNGYVGSTVTLTGTGFTGITDVKYGGSGGTSVGSFTVVNDTTLTFTIAAATAGTIYVENPAGNFTSAGSLTNLGYITTATGAWGTGGTWLGGATPASSTTTNVTLAHNITGTTGTIDTGRLTVNSGITLTITAASTVNVNTASTNSGTITDNGTFGVGTVYTNSSTFTVGNGGTLQINQGGFYTGTAPAYNATASSLTFNNATGQYVVTSGHVYWPASSGPVTVNVNGAGGVQLQPVRTVTNLNLAAAFDIQSASNLTVNGLLTINSGGSVTGNAPVYGGASTLVYNTTSNPYNIATEWTGNSTTAGIGVPFNVTIQNTNNVTMPNSNRGLAGNLQVLATSTLTLNSGSGDLYIAGNWTRAATTTFVTNSRAVVFNGALSQTITNTAGETFDYLLIDKSAGLLVLQNNVTITATSGNVLQLLNVGYLDINGKTLTFSGTNGNILVSGGLRNIASTLAGGIMNITGNKGVSTASGGTLVLGGNITTVLTAGMNFASGATTVTGTLQINAGGYVSSPCKYGNSSLLRYNTGTSYGRASEWLIGLGTIASTNGYPNNVQLSNNTTLEAPNGSTTGSLGLNGNLTIDSGSNLYMDFGGSSSISLTVNGNVVINGGLSLGDVSGGDMSLLGNWNRTGTFTPNGRTVNFVGGAQQTMTGNTTFANVTVNTAGAGVLLANNMIITGNLTLTSGKVTVAANNLTVSGNISGASSSNYVVTASSGKLIRTSVGNTATLFPVGFTATNYTPITLTNTTGTSDLSVSVKNSLTNAAADATKIVTLEWGVTSSAATTATITPTWVAATPINQAASFTNTGAGDVSVYTTSYTNYPVTLANTTTTATGVALQSGNNLVVVGNTNAVYSPPPANDNCGGAISLTVGAAAVAGTVQSATQSLASISCNGFSGNANDDVWYSFTTGAAGSYAVSVTGSASFDAVVDLRSGACNGTNVSCSDSGNVGVTETVIASLAATTTYFVRLYAYGAGYPAVPTFTISVENITPTITTFPASACSGSSIVINGTNFTGATAVTIGGTAATITNTTATALTVTVGNGTTGNIAVTTPGGVATSGSAITINLSPTAAWAAAATPVCASANALTTPLAYSATTNTPINYSITWNASPTNSFVAVTNQAHSFTGGGAGTITIDVPAGTAAGTYTGTITVSTASCTSTAVQTFTVTVNPTPAPTASNGGPYCPGDTIQLTGGPGGLNGYTWTGPNGYSSPVISQTTTQNFNTLGTGTVSWTDNSTLAGWYLLQGQGNATAPVTAVASLVNGTGSASAGAAYNLNNGTTTSDRAIGSLASSGISDPAGTVSFHYGVKITNTTGSTVTNATITYTGEQYKTQNTSAQSLTVDYSMNATALTTASGTWTAIPALTFTSPTNATGPTTLDGNNSANRVAGITTTLTGLSIPNNSSIWVRWTDTNDTGSDHVLAIDDVSIVLSVPSQNVSIANATTAMSGTYTLTASNTSGCSAIATTVVTVNPQPQGSLTANGPFCASGAGQLTWTATDGTGPYTVVYNDGVADRTATGVASGIPFTVFTSPVTATTTYTLVSVTDIHCSRNTSFTGSSATITVTPAPNAGTLSGTQAVCTNGTTTFTSNGDAGSWTSDDAGVATIDPTTGVITPVAAGTATMTYTVTGISPCGNATATRTVTVTTAPNAGTLSGTQTICTNGTTTFTSNGDSGSWTSDDTGVATIDPTTGVITPVAAGTATMTYTVTGTGPCADATATRTVTITTAPNAGTLSGTQTICTNGTTTFTSNGDSGSWTSDDTGVATIDPTTGVITPVAAGTATMTYTVTGTGPCANATATRTVTVTTAPNAGTLSGTQTICTNGTTTFTSNGDSGSWASDDTGVATIDSTTGVITPVAAGTATMTYTVTGTGPCADATATRTVTILALPTATISGNSGATTCSGSTVSFTLTGTSGSVVTYTINNGSPATATLVGGTADVIITNVTSTQTLDLVSVDNGTCSVSISGTSSISIGGSTTWTGTWSNGTPNSSMTATISANYTATANLSACSLTVNNNAVVNIPSGFDVTLNGALTVSSGSFTLQNNANLLQTTNAANSGNIIVKRNSSAIKRQDYTLWSSPVAGQNLLAFSPLTVVTPTSRFYEYNSLDNEYNGIDAPSAVTMADAKGYLIRVANNHPTFAWIWNGQFTGVPHNGNYSYSMFNGGEGLRFNLVGNPYPSPISAVNFAASNSANITQTLYFWRETNNTTENNAYCSWSPAGGPNGTFVTNNQAQAFDLNGVIQTGQGFFVEAINASTTVNFTNSMRVANHANQFFRHASIAALPSEIESHRIWLNVTNAAGSFCQTAFGYMTDATQNYDLGIDGKYINNGDTELYSIINAERYVIQGRALPFIATDVVPLGFKATAAGEYTIAIDHLDGLFTEGQNIYLRDNLTGTTHDLATPYIFTSDAGTFITRFDVVYQPALGVPGNAFENQVVIIKQNGGFAINSGNATMENVKVFDIRGRLLLEQKGISANTTTFNVGEANQVLIVKITSDDNRSVTKKIIN